MKRIWYFFVNVSIACLKWTLALKIPLLDDIWKSHFWQKERKKKIFRDSKWSDLNECKKLFLHLIYLDKISLPATQRESQIFLASSRRIMSKRHRKRVRKRVIKRESTLKVNEVQIYGKMTFIKCRCLSMVENYHRFGIKC